MPRPEVVLGRGKIHILESGIQECDFSTIVYLKITTMKSWEELKATSWAVSNTPTQEIDPLGASSIPGALTD